MKKRIILITVSLIVMLGIGILIGTRLGIKKDASLEQPKLVQNYASIIGEDVPGKIIEQEIRGAYGTVEKIEGKKISLKIDSNALGADSGSESVIAEVKNETKITRMTERNQQQYQQEIIEFKDKVKVYDEQQMISPDESIAPPVAPNRFDVKVVDFSDIKIGDTVAVVSDENIRNKKEFVATGVTVGYPLVMELEADINNASSASISPIGNATSSIQATNLTAPAGAKIAPVEENLNLVAPPVPAEPTIAPAIVPAE